VHNCQAASSQDARLYHSTKPVASYVSIFNLVDYRILAMLQECVCQHPLRDVDKLRQHLTDRPTIIDQAIDRW